MKKKINFVRNYLSSIIPDKNTADVDTHLVDTHLKEAMHWLARAQDPTDDGGVSSGFHLYHGWLLSYPETTGYIIETFLRYAKLVKNDQYKNRAIKMAEWLIDVQTNSGAIPDMDLKRKMVFDTGQAIFGFVEIYKETGIKKFQSAAIKAGDWLLSVQDENGSWVQHVASQIPHTYYSRVAWSLGELSTITEDLNYINSARRNIDWCLKQQTENGWFKNASFNLKNHHRPFTHTIAYTLRGILEVGLILNEVSYFDSVNIAMDHLIDKIGSDGFVGGTYDKEWNPDTKFSCLTGNAQFAILFFKMYQKFNKTEFKDIAIKLNQYLKRRQNIRTNNIGIKGAISGSYPIWGPYIHYNYPNWATKFFADSLLLERELS